MKLMNKLKLIFMKLIIKLHIFNNKLINKIEINYKNNNEFKQEYNNIL